MLYDDAFSFSPLLFSSVPLFLKETVPPTGEICDIGNEIYNAHATSIHAEHLFMHATSIHAFGAPFRLTVNVLVFDNTIYMCIVSNSYKQLCSFTYKSV